MCIAYAACVAECMLVDAGINAATGECNNFGDSAKGCAAGCLLGPLGAMGKSLGRAKDAACAINSFPSDTLVHTKPAWGTTQDAQLANASLKPISQLQVGDEVLALSDWKDKGDNPKLDKRLSYEKITDIYTSQKPQTLVHLALTNGETLTATEGHPFKTTEGWRDAILLKKGGKLLLKGSGDDSDTERTATIVDIRTEQKTLPVINLEVANAHTYFVGEDGLLVHNHGNSKNCSKPQYLYRIFDKNNNTKKFGVTSTPPNKNGLPRPNSQLRPGEQYEVIGTANNRSEILDMERNAVQNYKDNHGMPPVRNKLPRVK